MSGVMWAEFQLTKKQAVEIADRELWKKWNDKELVRMQLFQKRLLVPLDQFQMAVQRCIGRPVWTHELGMESSLFRIQKDFLKEDLPPSEEEILKMIPEDIIYTN